MRPVGVLSIAVFLLLALLVAGWLLVYRGDFGTPPGPDDPVEATGDDPAPTADLGPDDPADPPAGPESGARDASARGLPLAGQVVDRDGQPVAGAEIRARPLGDGPRPDSARSGADGRFRIDGLADARFSVRATARFHSPVSVKARAGTTDLALVLESAGEIRVVLTGPEEVDGKFPPTRTTLRTGAGGVEDWLDNEDHRSSEFLFEGIPPGEYRVRAAVMGEGTGTRAGLVVKAGATTEVRLPIEEGVVLEGLVVAAEDGAPVGGALVVAGEGDEPSWGIRLTTGERFALLNEGIWTRAGDDGRFRMVGLSAGRWTLAATAPGFEPAAETVDLPTRAKAVVRLATGAGLVVRVLDREGRPVRGAHVFAGFPNGGAHSGETDDAGIARFASLPPGEVSVSAQHVREWSLWASVAVIAGETTVRTLRLPEAGASLSGRVTRGGRLEVDRRVRVVLFDGKVSARYWTSTDAGGRYRFDGLPPGTVRVRVAPSRDEQEIALLPGGNTLDLELPTAGVRLLVVDHQTGQPIESARVSGIRYAHAHADGRIEIEDLEAVEQSLVVLARGYAPTRIRFTPGEEKPEVVTRLERGAVLRLRIVDPSGTEIADPHVMVRDADGWQVGGWASEDEAPVYRLAPGAYEVVIEHPDFEPWAATVEFGDTDQTETITLQPK